MPSTSATHPRRDLVLAAVVTAITVGTLSVLPALTTVDPDLAAMVPSPSHWQWWCAVVALIAQGVLLARVSASPERVLIAVAFFALVISLVPLGDGSSIALLAVIPATYVATRRRLSDSPWSPWWIAAALVAGASAITNVRSGETGIAVSLGAAAGQALVVVGLPALVGWAAAVRAESRTARERETVARAHELEARTEAAVAAERTAIARELHDIAAHHLSGIALMSSAISQQIDTDPDAAKAGLADVRTQTRELLGELRGLVALLRQDDGVAVDVATLAGLETLVPDAQARGLDVTLSMPRGADLRKLAEGIGPLSQFAAYRTVQEALANAARHAPTSLCTVTLRDADAALEIVVGNGPDSTVTLRAPGEGGFGLRGMEERAALTRSTLTYGQTDDGGWRVKLRIPREPGHLVTPAGADA